MFRLAGILLIFSAVLPVTAFAADFDQFKSAFNIVDLFNRKVVNSELKKNIWFVADGDERAKVEPLFSLFHETELIGGLANLQTGLTLTPIRDGDVSGDFDFGLSQMTFFSLWNLNYRSQMSAAASFLIAFYLLTPYFFDSTDMAVDSVHGVLLKFGNIEDPLLQMSAGMTFNSYGTSFGAVDNNLFFNLESPRYATFIDLVLDQGNVSKTNSLVNIFNFGLDYNYLSDSTSSRFRPVKSFKGFIQFDNVNKRQAAILDVSQLFGFMDFKGRFNFEGYLPTQMQYVRGGLNFFLSAGDEFSSIYQSAMQLKLYGSYYASQNDIYMAGRPLVSPYGFLAELSFQAPALLMVDGLLEVLYFNLFIVDLITGNSDGAGDMLSDMGKQADEMGRRLEQGAYQSDLFSRFVIGVSHNDPDTLEKFAFAGDSYRVYVKWNFFY